LVEGRVKVGDTGHTREFFFAQAHDFQSGEIVSIAMRSSWLVWDCSCSRWPLLSTYSGAKSSNASR
jgi:hypothetical protein